MITVKKARVILGNQYAQLTDDNIQCIIDMLYNLSKRMIREVVNNKIVRISK